jgi:hypothetical protein
MKIHLNIILAAILQIVLLGSCKDHGNSVTPQFLFDEQAIPIAEDDPDGTVSIPVYLSGESDRTVSVDYATIDSTAVAGKDYVGVTSGSLTFQPGELGKEIKLNIIPDTAGKKDVYFSIKLSNPVNGIISKSRIKIKIVNVDFANLVWSDEFNLFALNTTFWNYEQGASGWGNNELENYTNLTDNVHIDSGYLHITALNPSGTSYTSGRINTAGKQQFTYGRVDVRAKMPEGKGIWPALWMLGSNYVSIGWPRCGETDIMELLGHEPSIVHGTVHWFSNEHLSRTNSYTLSNGKFSSGFHLFSVVWTPNKLIWMVDKQQYFYLTREEIPSFPFDLPQFIICNVAVGGNWPGVPDETTVFPQHMIVDYVRVYQ